MRQQTFFICQLTENVFKLLKCISDRNSKSSFPALEVEQLASDIDNKQLAQRIAAVFKRIGYNRQPIIICLPRNQATCRQVRIPAQSPIEIEKIASLQACQYLPYPADELITAFGITSLEKDGYATVNLTIVHRDVISRYLEVFSSLQPKNMSIILSSYGLRNLYRHLKPSDTQSAALVDFDANQANLAIVSRQNLFFSRYFKLNRAALGWESQFSEEINKSLDTYRKEFPREAVGKIVILGSSVFSGKLSVPVEFLPFKGQKDKIGEHSFLSLLGLGLGGIEDSLHLLPPELKAKQKRLAHYKKHLRKIIFIAATCTVLVSAVFKNLDNKAKYLGRLEEELGKIAKDARPLEEVEKRFRVLESQSKKSASSLDILHSAYLGMPAGLFLTNFNYEAGRELILRGQAQEMGAVFAFVAQLENAATLKEYNIKVRFATKKKLAGAEVVSFEIAGTKK